VADEFYVYDWEKWKDNTLSLKIEFPNDSDKIAKAIYDMRFCENVEEGISIKSLTDDVLKIRQEIFRTRLFLIQKNLHSQFLR